MSLLNRVREAAGGARWAGLRHFKTYLMLHGSVVAPLEGTHRLKEIVAEGDVVARSLRVSGFSDTSGEWGFHPGFVTIQHDDGGFVGARREAAPRPFRGLRDEAELVWLCGFGIWSCMTVPLVLFTEGLQSEELGPWSEQGQTWDRLQVTTPQDTLTYAREAVMYFDADGMLRRTDFELHCGRIVPIVAYSSAPQCFEGFTVPTLHRALRGATPGGVPGRTPLLDVEIFDAAFT